MNKKKRVLQVLGGLYLGGTETFVMNIFREINKEKTEFLFLIHEKKRAYFDDEVEELGGTIYRIPDRTEIGFLKYLLNLIRILKIIKPDVIHSHGMFNSGAVMFGAFLAGIKKRVSHSHSSNDQFGDNISRKIFRNIMRFSIRVFSTNYAACSGEAAKFLFGNQVLHNSKLQIINNGINFKKFSSITADEKEKLRKEINILNDNYVVGLVSRLVNVKNPLFVINLLEKLVEHNKNIVVIFVGEGPLKNEIKRKTIEKGLLNNIRLIGNRSDVPILLGIFDLFLLPSIFEGFPISIIEAQSQGIPSIVSSNVSPSVDLGLDLVKFVPLEDEIEWINLITSKLPRIDNRIVLQNALKDRELDIESSANKLALIYQL